MVTRGPSQNQPLEGCLSEQREGYLAQTTASKRCSMGQGSRKAADGHSYCPAERRVRSQSRQGSSFQEDSSTGYSQANERERQNLETIFARENVRGAGSQIGRAGVLEKDQRRQSFKHANQIAVRNLMYTPDSQLLLLDKTWKTDNIIPYFTINISIDEFIIYLQQLGFKNNSYNNLNSNLFYFDT